MNKTSILSVLFLALLTISCLNDGLSETKDTEGMVAELADQALSIESSITELEAVISTIGDEAEKEGLIEISNELAEHVDYLKSGASWLNGTAATLQRQKALATAIAAIDETTAVKRLEKGVAEWIGEDFTNYYKVAKAAAKADAMASALNSGQLVIEGLESDVEAGLRTEVDTDELSSLGNSVEENTARLAEMSSKLHAMDTELEDGYMKAIEAAVTSSDVNLAVLDELNDNARVVLKSAGTSLADLSDRIEALETRIETILSNLEKIEADINELLGMVQSVTFMSEYAENYAPAYYNLNPYGERTPEGYMERRPSSVVKMNYMIRPASAAKALTSSSLWNNGIEIIGYYARSITKASFDYIDFNITKIELDEASGIISVTASHNLKDEFFYQKTGAKFALAISTDNTEIASSFTEILPKDEGTTVYVKDIKLADDKLEIDNNQSTKLTATVTPENATNTEVTWESSNNDIVSVAYDGTITAHKVGTATVTATTSGIDEWGMNHSASCTITVKPSISISGDDYVEVGHDKEYKIQSINHISQEFINWELGTVNAGTNEIEETTYATISTSNGVATVHGAEMYYEKSLKEYKPLTLRCTISGAEPVILDKEIRIVAVQPQGIKINGLSDIDNSIDIKVGQSKDLSASLLPADEVDNTLFRISYNHDYSGNAYISETGFLTTEKWGIANITISTQAIIENYMEYNYSYPKGKSISRNIRVNIKPYYIESMTFSESGTPIGKGITLAAGSTTSVKPVFTSDGGAGVEPTFGNVTWSSSDPTKVSVDQDGNIKAVSTINGDYAIITATTSDPGQNEYKTVTAQFIVSITQAWHSFNVGDYVLRLMDNTIGFCSNPTSRPSGSTIVGIVISDSSPRANDPSLPSTCSHGIALGLGEGAAGSWISSTDNGPVYNWTGANGYISTAGCYYANSWEGVVRNEQGKLPLGYNNTTALKKFIDAHSGLTSPMITSLNQYSTNLPTDASSWYIPSIAEMDFITAQSSTLNNLLSAAGGTQLSNTNYWTSSEQANQQSWAPYINPISGTLNSHSKTNSHPVRFVFAF